MFDVCHAFTAKWEGGLSDHPNDTGGITNFGCSMVFVRSLARTRPELLQSLNIPLQVTPDVIRNLQAWQAARLLKAEFWQPLGLDDFKPAIACALYDAAVNSGRVRSLRWMQTAVNKTASTGLTVDGIMGPKTRDALQKPSSEQALPIALQAVQERRLFLLALADKNPSQKAFLKGWLNRCDSLLIFLTSKF